MSYQLYSFPYFERRLQNFHALTILVSEREITLLDIGSHDEVYRG